MSNEYHLTLIGKPGCHLCDEAEVVISRVLSEVEGTVKFSKKNILEDQDLFAEYSEEIPVLLIDGKVHNYWHIDAERLRSALAG